MILRFLFYAFLIYLLYKLVFHFIIPVYRTTRQVKRGFKEMQERMHQHGAGTAYPPQAGTVQQTTSTGKKGNEDYLDFEEVKD
jgi:hypothetical protein